MSSYTTDTDFTDPQMKISCGAGSSSLILTQLASPVDFILHRMVQDDRFESWLNDARHGKLMFDSSNMYQLGTEPNDKPFANYVPMKLIHTGFQSTVFLITPDVLSKKLGGCDTDEGIVLKFIQKDKLEGGGELHHAREEVRFLQTIQHPFLVGSLCGLETRSHIAMATRFASHGELGSRMKCRVLPESEARNICFQILLALRHLHSQGIVHCDLKPENLVLFALTEAEIQAEVMQYLSTEVCQQQVYKTHCKRSLKTQKLHPASFDPKVLTRCSSRPSVPQFQHHSSLAVITSSEKLQKATTATLIPSEDCPLCSITSEAVARPDQNLTCLFEAKKKNNNRSSSDVRDPTTTEHLVHTDEKFLVVKIVDFGLSQVLSKASPDSPTHSPAHHTSSPSQESSSRSTNSYLPPFSLPKSSSNQTPSLLTIPLPHSSGMPQRIKFECVRGTHGFIAPEILLRQDYTEKVDIWSLGAIVFHALVGYEPFFPASNCIKGDVDIEQCYWSNLSPEASDFVCCLLRRDPQTRFSADDALNHPWFTVDLNSPSAIDSGKHIRSAKRIQMNEGFVASSANHASSQKCLSQPSSLTTSKLEKCKPQHQSCSTVFSTTKYTSSSHSPSSAPVSENDLSPPTFHHNKTPPTQSRNSTSSSSCAGDGETTSDETMVLPSVSSCSSCPLCGSLKLYNNNSNSLQNRSDIDISKNVEMDEVQQQFVDVYSVGEVYSHWDVPQNKGGKKFLFADVRYLSDVLL